MRWVNETLRALPDVFSASLSWRRALSKSETVMRTNSYEDAEGKKRYSTEVIASSVNLMPGGNHHEGGVESADENEPELAAV